MNKVIAIKSKTLMKKMKKTFFLTKIKKLFLNWNHNLELKTSLNGKNKISNKLIYHILVKIIRAISTKYQIKYWKDYKIFEKSLNIK